MSRPWRLRILLALVAASASIVAFWLWDHRGYWLADNVREIEAGRIYAGGFQYNRPLQRIVRQYGIKTVLSLREGGDDYELQERALLESEGVEFHKLVIPYKVSDADRIVSIEQAVEFISDERHQPVYVHCWAGCHRTGAVVAIYRISRCRWTEQQAERELISWGGMSLGTQWPTRVLHAYCTSASPSMASQSDPAELR